jgi:hypothetical protein
MEPQQPALLHDFGVVSAIDASLRLLKAGLALRYNVLD